MAHAAGRLAAPKVVLVEDDTDVREDLKFLIESRGYAVIGVGNGQEAIDLLAKMDEPPALILLDLMMPMMNGWSLQSALQTDARMQSVPIVVVSGVADVEAQARALGAFDFLSKPIDLQRLWALLAHVCGPLSGSQGGSGNRIPSGNGNSKPGRA